MAEGAEVARAAAAEAQATDGTVQGLAQAASKIGDVVRLIGVLDEVGSDDGSDDGPETDGDLPVPMLGALEDLLVRISALADAHPEVSEIDCDPVVVTGAGAAVAGARVHVRPARPARPFPALDR